MSHKLPNEETFEHIPDIPVKVATSILTGTQVQATFKLVCFG